MDVVINMILFIVNVLRIFFTMPWVGLRCVIMAFPDLTHLPFNDMGRDARRPVFGISDKVRFKPACSATKTS